MTNMIIDHYYIDYIDYFCGFMFVLLPFTFTFNLLTIYYFHLRKILLLLLYLYYRGLLFLTILVLNIVLIIACIISS